MTYRVRNIVVAVGLALVAMLLTLLYVKNVRRSAQTSVATVQIYVAAKDLAAGTSGSEIVRSHDLRVESVQKRDVVPGAISSTAQIDSLMLAAPLYQGEQATLRRFTSAAAEGIRAQLTGTMRAVQVPGDADQLLVGTLQPGDRVDLVANLHLTSTTGVQSTATRIALRNLRVLSTSGGGAVAKVGGPSSSASSSVILAVTDSQVQRLFYVLKNADWTLELRPVLNPVDGNGNTETAAQMLKGGL
jgi:Flp pilus assembly protein CpaB